MALQELTHTLGVLHTRHFHHDAAFLSVEFLDVGLHHAKLVDPVGDDVFGIIYSLLHFGAQDAQHFIVIVVGLHLGQLAGGKDFSQVVSGGVLPVVLHEEVDEIALSLLLFSAGFLHGFHEGGVFLVASKIFDKVRNGDLQDYVHTAFQVKSETDLCLLTLLI